MGGVRHGHARKSGRTPEYKAWDGMKTRCNNPRHKLYPYYGARGITVCEAWNRPDGFGQFLADMGPRPSRHHTLDRIDNSRGYSPDNCRWATWGQQQRNTRRSHLITINGNTKPLCDWAEVFRIPHQYVRNRIYQGWEPIRALVTPCRRVSRSAP
jgi:hypothetical protein